MMAAANRRLPKLSVEDPLIPVMVPRSLLAKVQKFVGERIRRNASGDRKARIILALMAGELLAPIAEREHVSKEYVCQVRKLAGLAPGIPGRRRTQR